jgi:hypothetical protein
MVVVNVLVFVVLTAIAVAVFWLVARFLGVPRPFRGETGIPWVDAQDAFDRARKEHGHRHLAAVLRGRPHDLDLPSLQEATALGLIGRRSAREFVLPLSDIVGTADGGGGKFDRYFLPTDDRSRGRFQEIVIAHSQGKGLEPIEVYRLRGHYYVYDGHHRVAAAHALGEKDIAAYVTDVRG